RLYSTDASIYQIEPLGVVIPRTLEDIVASVQIAAEMHIPITARGGGTSLSGQSIGPGSVRDCSKHLNPILDIDARACVARNQQAAVRWKGPSTEPSGPPWSTMPARSKAASPPSVRG